VVGDASIRQQHTGPASARDDDHVFALGGGQERNATSEIQQVTQAVGANHATLIEHIFINLVITGKRSGVRTGGLGTRRRAPPFQHNDRLFLRNATSDFGEGTTVFQVFAMLRDDLGIGVLLEENQQVVFVNVALVADTD